MQQLKPQDAAFLYVETQTNLTHVTGLTIYDPSSAPGARVRFEDVVAHVRSRLHTSPVFTRRLIRVPLELDYPYWEDDEHFDLEHHLSHSQLLRPGDWRQLCTEVARYHSSPLDMQRPPWEIHFIEGLTKIPGLATGAYALATKIHHVAVDGASGMRLFSALADKDVDGTPALEIEPGESPRCAAPALPEMLLRAFGNNARSPVRMANTVLRAAPSVFDTLRRNLREASGSRGGVPDTRFNTSVSQHKVFDGTAFELAEFSAVRKAVDDVTINDVVLAVCAGGLRRYLITHDELPRESLVAWVPVNARTRGESTDGDERGNNISAMTAAIHTDIDDELERLRAIAATTRQTKAAKSGISARLMTDLSRHAPSATQALAGRLVSTLGSGPRMCNLFVSNVPGPQIPLYMIGALQISTYGMAPLINGMGLFIATPSYNGSITFGVTSTREILPDIDVFVQCLRDSFQALSRAASAGKRPATRKPAGGAGKKKAAKKKATKKKAVRR